MDLKELFLDVKNNYKEGDFKDHPTAQLLREGPPKLIPEAIFDKNKYTIVGSPGKGNWAGIPWITINNRNISSTAQEGIYIVYLFTANYDEVYLCIGTGWTYFAKNSESKKAAMEDIKKFTRFVRTKVNSVDEASTFNAELIDLDPDKRLNHSTLANGYEAGTIYSKKYIINDQLTNEELLVDLVELRTVYRELINQMGITDINTFKKVVREAVNTDEIDLERQEVEKSVKNFSTDEIALELEISEIPDMTIPKRSSSQGNLSFINRDYLKEASRNSKIGRMGEEVAVKYEQNRLLEAGYSLDQIEISDLAGKKIDGAGYDLISTAFNELGEEIRYIEVKTTTGKIDSPFYMSPNELNIREEFGEDYYIYRIYNITGNNPGIFIIPNNNEVRFEEVPTNYLIYTQLNFNH